MLRVGSTAHWAGTACRKCGDIWGAGTGSGSNTDRGGHRRRVAPGNIGGGRRTSTQDGWEGTARICSGLEVAVGAEVDPLPLLLT